MGFLVDILVLSIVPFISHLFFPVGFLLNLLNSFFDDCKCCSNVKVFHVLFIIKLICEFKEIINFSFFSIFILFLSFGPCWFRFAFCFRFFRWSFLNRCLRNSWLIVNDCLSFFKKVICCLKIVDFVTLLSGTSLKILRF